MLVHSFLRWIIIMAQQWDSQATSASQCGPESLHQRPTFLADSKLVLPNPVLSSALPLLSQLPAWEPASPAPQPALPAVPGVSQGSAPTVPPWLGNGTVGPSGPPLSVWTALLNALQKLAFYISSDVDEEGEFAGIPLISDDEFEKGQEVSEEDMKEEEEEDSGMEEAWTSDSQQLFSLWPMPSLNVDCGLLQGQIFRPTDFCFKFKRFIVIQ